MFRYAGMRSLHVVALRFGLPSTALSMTALRGQHTMSRFLSGATVASMTAATSVSLSLLTPRRQCSSSSNGSADGAAGPTTAAELSQKALIELNKEATEAFEKGEFVTAVEAWEKVAHSKQHTPNSPTLMSCLNNLACAYGEMGDNVRKLKLLERSRGLVATVYGTDHPQYGMVLYNMACAKEEMGLYNDMKALLDESLALHEKRFNPRHAKVGRVLLLLAAAEGHLGNYAAQLKTAERALEIVRRHCGLDHVQTTVAMMTLGRACGAAGQAPRQLQLVQAAYNIQEKRLGPKNAQLALTLMELADAHRANGDHHNERALLEEAVEIQKRAFGQQHTHFVDTYVALGDACGSLKEPKMQAQYYLEALRIAQQRYQGRHVAIGKAAVNGARAYLLQGSVPRAAQLLEEARVILERNVSPVHPLFLRLEEVTQELRAMKVAKAEPAPTSEGK